MGNTINEKPPITGADKVQKPGSSGSPTEKHGGPNVIETKTSPKPEEADQGGYKKPIPEVEAVQNDPKLEAAMREFPPGSKIGKLGTITGLPTYRRDKIVIPFKQTGTPIEAQLVDIEMLRRMRES